MTLILGSGIYSYSRGLDERIFSHLGEYDLPCCSARTLLHEITWVVIAINKSGIATNALVLKVGIKRATPPTKKNILSHQRVLMNAYPSRPAAKKYIEIMESMIVSTIIAGDPMSSNPGLTNRTKGVRKATIPSFIAWNPVFQTVDLAMEQATQTAGQFGGTMNIDIPAMNMKKCAAKTGTPRLTKAGATKMPITR